MSPSKRVEDELHRSDPTEEPEYGDGGDSGDGGDMDQLDRGQPDNNGGYKRDGDY